MIEAFVASLTLFTATSFATFIVMRIGEEMTSIEKTPFRTSLPPENFKDGEL